MRPKKEKSQEKSMQISVRFTPPQMEILASLAANSGKTKAEYLRSLLLGVTPKPRAVIVHDDADILQELHAINRVGNNLNQIARYLNQNGQMTNILAKEIRNTLNELNAAVLKLNHAIEDEYTGR